MLTGRRVLSKGEMSHSPDRDTQIFFHLILSLEKKTSLIRKEEKLKIFWKGGQCLAD